MTSPSPRDRFFLYPEPIRAPDVPYHNERKPNPGLRGWVLVVAAFVIEWIGVVRRHAWANAGFGSLGGIRQWIESTEPRFDPTVFPREEAAGSDESKGGEVDAASEFQALAGRLAPRPNSVAQYRALYLSGELTPLDVVQAILPLIRRDTSPPGEHSLAWFEVNIELVLKAAKASTLRYKEGRSLGPLDGVPTAVKDEYDMKGYKTTLGSLNDYAGHGSAEGIVDTWCVKKIEEAGAIILGKLSMHEFGLDTTGNNIFYGTPRNPYNSGYYTGGSSSGSAYAVAAGLLPFAMGSDGGGSIRIPASMCSAFGLKTTHGRLSFFPGQNHSKTCGVNGPIAADMQSLAALYAVVSAPHITSYFPMSRPRTLTSPSPRPKLLGIPEAWFEQATPAIQKLCRGMIDRLVQQKGYTVIPITIPFLTHGQTAHAMTVLTDGSTLLPDTRGLSPGNRVLLALGRVTPATDYLLAQKLRHVLMQHLAWLFTTHPGLLIVTPTTACAGLPIRSRGELAYGVNDGDQTIASMEYVWLANFTGVPSISVPAGYVVPEGQPGAGEVAGAEAEGKIPVGLMAAGEWASEDELLRFGLDAEEVGMEAYNRPPGWVDVVERARVERGAVRVG